MNIAPNNTEAYTIKVDAYGWGESWGYSGPAPASMQILPMIEDRIRNSIRKEVEEVRAGLVETLGVEARKLGLRLDARSAQFAEMMAKDYGEKLVRDRIVALVDSLLPPAQDAAA